MIELLIVWGGGVRFAPQYVVNPLLLGVCVIKDFFAGMLQHVLLWGHPILRNVYGNSVILPSLFHLLVPFSSFVHPFFIPSILIHCSLHALFISLFIPPPLIHLSFILSFRQSFLRFFFLSFIYSSLLHWSFDAIYLLLSWGVCHTVFICFCVHRHHCRCHYHQPLSSVANIALLFSFAENKLLSSCYRRSWYSSEFSLPCSSVSVCEPAHSFRLCGWQHSFISVCSCP